MTLRLHELCCGNPDVLAWLEEHGLDPAKVALMDHLGPFIDGDEMTVHIYVEKDGHRFLNEAGDDAVVEARKVTLLRPPPNLHFIDGTPFPATVDA